jgi:hypothetical protein
MRTSIDTLRSLKRYTYEALGDSWEVRLLVEQGTFDRPGAQVLEASPQQITGPQNAMDIIQSFSIHAFPEPGVSVVDSLLKAGEAEDCLVRAFRMGIGEGHAGLVPLYDYEAVPHNAGSTSRRAPDYARILDLSIRREQNPSDELLFTVAAEVRLGWRRNAALTSAGKVATDIIINLNPT